MGRRVQGPDLEVKLLILEGMKDGKDQPYAQILVPARALKKAHLLVNTEILEAGLARIDFKSVPRGREAFFEEREARARTEGRGIWSAR